MPVKEKLFALNQGSFWQPTYNYGITFNLFLSKPPTKKTNNILTIILNKGD